MATERVDATGAAAELVPRLEQRAAGAERLRRLPDETIADYEASGLGRLLMPARYGGDEQPFPSILPVARELAHGCTSSAWTLSFYVLHNWMLSLFGEQAQDEVFGDGRPVRAPAPLAPTGRGLPADGGVTLGGRWAWATGVMHAEWVILGALCGADEAIVPALVLLPMDDVRIEDVWHTEGMRATGSNDVVVEDAFVPEHRIVPIPDIYAGTAPGAALHDSRVYRWPMVPALAMLAAMPALGTAERMTAQFAERLGERVLAHGGGTQKDKPAAQMRLGEAQVRLRACSALVDETMAGIEAQLATGERVRRAQRAAARLAAAHVVAESRRVIALLLEASGGSVHFLDHPFQRARRDVDTLSGHVIFEYDTARELAGATAIGMKISPIAMV